MKGKMKIMEKSEKKLGLFQQIIRFGIVGFICFGIDFGLTMVLKVCGLYYMIAAFVGFLVSVIANYILSFRFVFKRKEDLDRKTEFIVFVILSAIGCGINELVIWLCVSCVYDGSARLTALYNDTWAVAIGKVIATAVVMFYNFVTRKKFLSAD
jgi:putative flippase GtrA